MLVLGGRKSLNSAGRGGDWDFFFSDDQWPVHPGNPVYYLPYPRNPGSHSENGFMDPKYYAFWDDWTSQSSSENMTGWLGLVVWALWLNILVDCSLLFCWKVAPNTWKPKKKWCSIPRCSMGLEYLPTFTHKFYGTCMQIFHTWSIKRKCFQLSFVTVVEKKQLLGTSEGVGNWKFWSEVRTSNFWNTIWDVFVVPGVGVSYAMLNEITHLTIGMFVCFFGKMDLKYLEDSKRWDCSTDFYHLHSLELT